MKTTITSIIAYCLLCVCSVAKDIPSDSKQFMDFRGKPNFSNIEYIKLYKCKTYEELREQLIKAIASISPKDGAEWEDASQGNAVATCQLALVRTNYILGDIEKADKLLIKFHPASD